MAAVRTATASLVFSFYYFGLELARYLKIRMGPVHELSIALSIVDVATEEARRHGGTRVVAVHLKLGPLSGVVREALVSAFELAREGSLLEHARLAIEDVAVVAWCPACSAEQPVASVQHLCCPQCGAPTAEIIRGRELEVTALEIEA